MEIGFGWLRRWSRPEPSKQVARLFQAPLKAPATAPAGNPAPQVAPPLPSAAPAVATPAPAVDAGGLNARAGKLAAAQADLVRARAQTTRLFDVKVGIRARVAELVARLSTPGKAFPEDAASLVLARKNLEQIDDHFRVALGRQQTALHVRDALIVTGPI